MHLLKFPDMISDVLISNIFSKFHNKITILQSNEILRGTRDTFLYLFDSYQENAKGIKEISEFKNKRYNKTITLVLI